jgi:NAD(P)-dependent dehydrogenase (short-subunit alcohol dehydrogenase family)
MGFHYGTTIENILPHKADAYLHQGVNLNGTLNSMRAQLKYLGKGGSIVNIASVAGLFGQWKALAYTASKHAVVGLSRTAANDYGEKGLRVNAICPGPIVTPLFEEGVKEGPYTEELLGSMCALKRCGLPEIGQ